MWASSSCHCPRLPSLRLGSVVLLLLPLLLLSQCPVTPCLSLSGDARQQHNVWYNGLFISGIAVDEASGDVHFSDAAANRVVRQSANGTLLAEYRSSFYSPMQLAYYKGTLYVADSSNNRIVMIDVHNGGTTTFSRTPAKLGSCNGVAVNTMTGHVTVIDGWGLNLDVYLPDSDRWATGRSIDLSRCVPEQAFVASVSVQPSKQDDGAMFVGLPPRVSYSGWAGPPPNTSILHMSNDATAVQIIPGNETANDLWYALTQEGADEPMEIYVFDDIGTVLNQWITPAKPTRRWATTPFYGWAMHVDSRGNMYISDHGVDEQSRYGRVVKIAPNLTELAQWSMSDGVAYSPSSIWYDQDTTASGLCTYWMTDSERGMVQVAADGSVLLPFIEPPIDPADAQTARFTGMAKGSATLAEVNGSALVLLDTASATTSKLWRFSPSNRTYTLLNTTSAQLGPNVVGVTVNYITHDIYVSDTRTRAVLRLHAEGELDASFDTSHAGLVEPAGLVLCQVWQHSNSLCIADSGYNGLGAVLLMDGLSGAVYKVLNDTKPRMRQPRSVRSTKRTCCCMPPTIAGSSFSSTCTSRSSSKRCISRHQLLAT